MLRLDIFSHFFSDHATFTQPLRKVVSTQNCLRLEHSNHLSLTLHWKCSSSVPVASLYYAFEEAKGKNYIETKAKHMFAIYPFSSCHLSLMLGPLWKSSKAFGYVYPQIFFCAPGLWAYFHYFSQTIMKLLCFCIPA